MECEDGWSRVSPPLRRISQGTTRLFSTRSRTRLGCVCIWVYDGVVTAGLYALEHHIARLADDHANAQTLAQGLSQIPGGHTHTNTHTHTRAQGRLCTLQTVLAAPRSHARLHVPRVYVCVCSTTAGISCDPSLFRTNIVYFELSAQVEATELVRRLRDDHNVLIGSE
jgi:hypothetical protein